MLLVPSIQECSLVRQLAAAIENTTADHWTPVNEVARCIRRKQPTMITDHLAKFGLKSLTQLLVASELFDIKLEPTETGGHRTFVPDQRAGPTVPPSTKLDLIAN